MARVAVDGVEELLAFECDSDSIRVHGTNVSQSALPSFGPRERANKRDLPMHVRISSEYHPRRGSIAFDEE